MADDLSNRVFEMEGAIRRLTTGQKVLIGVTTLTGLLSACWRRLAAR